METAKIRKRHVVNKVQPTKCSQQNAVNNSNYNGLKKMIRNRAKRYTSKIIGFIRENKKEILMAAVTVVVVWFFLELILNFADFADGFSEGMK